MIRSLVAKLLKKILEQRTNKKTGTRLPVLTKIITVPLTEAG